MFWRFVALPISKSVSNNFFLVSSDTEPFLRTSIIALAMASCAAFLFSLPEYDKREDTSFCSALLILCFCSSSFFKGIYSMSMISSFRCSFFFKKASAASSPSLKKISLYFWSKESTSCKSRNSCSKRALASGISNGFLFLPAVRPYKPFFISDDKFIEEMFLFVPAAPDTFIFSCKTVFPFCLLPVNASFILLGCSSDNMR